MRKHRRHIIVIVVTALISVTLYAARTNSDRLSLLQPLVEYNHPFSPDTPVNNIIAWELHSPNQQITHPLPNRQKRTGQLKQAKDNPFLELVCHPIHCHTDCVFHLFGQTRE